MVSCKMNSIRDKGSAIAELAAAIAIVLPLVVTVIYVAVEAAQAYTISNCLANSAQRAARQLAINYGQDSVSAMANTSQVFNQIQYLNIVNDASQFSIPSGGWNTTTNPSTVTVIVTYHSNQHGCPPFPNPDPLQLGSSFVLSSRATSRLE